MVTRAEGRSVVVTGATNGIGKVTALALARGGFEVFATARSPHKAAALTEEAARAGLKLRTVICDVADEGQTAEAFAEVANATGGGPWAVVNNAGYAQPGTVEDVPEDQALQQMDVNLLAPVRIAKLVLPGMRERGGGRIVNMSSFGGLISTPYLGWYSASKFALEAISDALRLEVAQFGVRVILVEPGGFASGIWQRGVDALPPPEGSAYAHLYGLAEGMMAYARGLPGPEPVARAVHRALISRRPRARYLVGADAKVGTLMETVFPAAAMDYVKSVRYGLHSPRSRASRIGAGLVNRLVTARSSAES
jgi:NAD(P)-dependent dehydrogenase (short-subunit alcohol dehydrogenase family)